MKETEPSRLRREAFGDPRSAIGVRRPRRKSGAPYFVSFHPKIDMEENLPLLQTVCDRRVQELLSNAAGVLLPKYVSPWRHKAITRFARSCFPRLEGRYVYCGKVAQIRLFRRLGVTHPESCLFDNPKHLDSFWRQWGSPWGYPVVLKGDTGGGGSRVFPIYRPDDLDEPLGKLPADQPVLLQRLVRHGGRDLRVVVYGDHQISYFREGADEFYNNVSRGGRVRHSLWPEVQRIGAAAAQRFCQRVPIDVAALDIMFETGAEPILVEVNFNFGTKGLGGRKMHDEYFQRAVLRWRHARLKAPITH